jgi:hypothetical protein
MHVVTSIKLVSDCWNGVLLVEGKSAELVVWRKEARGLGLEEVFHFRCLHINAFRSQKCTDWRWRGTQDWECRESPKEISQPETTFQAASAITFHVGSRVFLNQKFEETNARKLPWMLFKRILPLYKLKWDYQRTTISQCPSQNGAMKGGQIPSLQD